MSSGTLPAGGVDGIWITPSLPLPASPNGPLFSDVVTPVRGRAVRRPSWPGLDCAEPTQLPTASDATALPAVAKNCLRVRSIGLGQAKAGHHILLLRLPLFIQEREDSVDVEPAGAGVRPARHFDVLVV